MAYVIVAIVLFFLLSMVIIYKMLIRKKHDIEIAFASIEVMFRKR